MNCGKNQAKSGTNSNVKALAFFTEIRYRTPILALKKFSYLAKI